MSDLAALARAALEEDIGPGDLTSRACIPAELQAEARIFAKQELVLSGGLIAREVFAARGCSYRPIVPDGAMLSPGQDAARITGPARELLTAERVALNFLMRLSGVATHTREVVAAAGGRIKVVDTRKTTPLHRALEKAAVRHGGAFNHRFALYDGVLIKDNHLRGAGGVRAAMEAARRGAHHLIRVQVEVETLEQLEEALACGAEALLLDNMDDATLNEAVRRVGGRALTEASGNMTAERITRLARLEHPPDMVSVGGLIHQARWADLSLDLLV